MRFRECHVLLGFALLFSPAAKATSFNFESDNTGSIPVYPGMTTSGWFTATVPNTAAGTIDAYTDLTKSGLATDPAGGLHFLGLVKTPDASSATRAQHGFGFSSDNEWTASYDFFVVDTSQTVNTFGSSYIGSFVVQNSNPGSTSFFVLNAWDNSSASSTLSSSYYVYDSAGNVQNAAGVVPGAAWSGLNQDHWYSESTAFDEATNLILSVSITDLTTNSTTTVTPTGWYMNGGAGATFQADSIRFSGYGLTNAFGVDNVNISTTPEPGTFGLIGLGIVALGFARRPRRA